MKYIGCLFIMCGCLAISSYYEIKEKNKIKYLGYMTDFIKYIESKISFFLTPKHILFREYENSLIESLVKNDFKDLNLYFDKETAAYLNDFFNNFGHGLKDEQINSCKYTVSRLVDARTKAENEIKNKIKVLRALVLFAGATLCILIV